MQGAYHTDTKISVCANPFKKHFLNTCICKALSWAIYYEHAGKTKSRSMHIHIWHMGQHGVQLQDSVRSAHTHTHTWLKNRRTQYSRLRLWVDLQGRYITLGEQVPVVKVNTFNVLRKAKCSSKTCIEKNLLDCPSSLLCPANVSTLRSNAISLMKPLLADSLGK